MSGFVEGIDRSQSTFFPAMLDDYVAEVRVRLDRDHGFQSIVIINSRAS